VSCSDHAVILQHSFLLYFLTLFFCIVVLDIFIEYRRGGVYSPGPNGIALSKTAVSTFLGPPGRARGNSKEAFQLLLAKTPPLTRKRRNSTGCDTVFVLF
jgi:hypothetical protein